VGSGAVPRVRSWAVWIMVVVPVAALLLSGVYFATALPGCVACHDESTFVEQTQSATHSAVECVDCHVSTAVAARVSFGYREAFHMVLPIVSGEGRGWAAVPDSRCLKCHEMIGEAVVQAKGIKVDHSVCAVGASCTDCHSSVAHGASSEWVRAYDMDTCLECHSPQESAQCDLCHDGRGPAERITSGVFAITHGPQWEKTHGMGNSLTCSACHTAASCDKCHGPGLPHTAKFVEKHSSIASSPGAKCFTCHEQAMCDDCHGLDMPHPRTFTRSHSDAAETNRDLCNRCHAASDCTTCHEKHVHPGGAVGSTSSYSAGKGGAS
jgi:hypothetical protein